MMLSSWLPNIAVIHSCTYCDSPEVRNLWFVAIWQLRKLHNLSSTRTNTYYAQTVRCVGQRGWGWDDKGSCSVRGGWPLCGGLGHEGAWASLPVIWVVLLSNLSVAMGALTALGVCSSLSLWGSDPD